MNQSSPEIDLPVTPTNQRLSRTSRQYNLISAGLALFVWGGWAWFVNTRADRVGAFSPLGSGVIQGSASCLITFIMVGMVTRLFPLFQNSRFCLVLPAIVTTSLTGTCITAAHVLAGTADVPTTVVPGLIVALCFNTLTTWKLRQNTP